MVFETRPLGLQLCAAPDQALVSIKWMSLAKKEERQSHSDRLHKDASSEETLEKKMGAISTIQKAEWKLEKPGVGEGATGSCNRSHLAFIPIWLLTIQTLELIQAIVVLQKKTHRTPDPFVAYENCNQKPKPDVGTHTCNPSS